MVSKQVVIQRTKDFFSNNGSYKLVAFFIALILWVTVLGSKDQTIIKNVKLNFNLPKNQIIANGITDQAQIQISGSRLSLKKISRGLDPLEIDLNDVKPGRTIVAIPVDQIVLPFGAQIVNVNPSTIVVDIDRIASKKVPIKVLWDIDDEPKNLKVLRIDPSSVLVKGASSVLARVQEIWTEPVNPNEVVFSHSRKRVEFRVGLKDFNYYGIMPIENKTISISIVPKNQ